MKILLLTLTTALFLIGCNESDSNNNNIQDEHLEQHQAFLYIDANNRELLFEDKIPDITINSSFNTVLQLNNQEIVFIKKTLDFSQENLLTENNVTAQLKFYDDHFSIQENVEIHEINQYIEKQHHIYEEINKALLILHPEENLCNFFIDSNNAHYALTNKGKVYRFIENETGLEASENTIQLTGIASIAQCNQTNILQVSNEEIAIFIAEAGHKRFLVDSHGAAYHLHSIEEFTQASSLNITHMLYFGDIEMNEHEH